ncbi:MAG: DUF1549 and DUF1553 domain-containing protein [Pirellulales bacterium]|nr:DUF1549 and DUF1553 domain-containing protein [Pirellulales bacterium]
MFRSFRILVFVSIFAAASCGLGLSWNGTLADSPDASARPSLEVASNTAPSTSVKPADAARVVDNYLRKEALVDADEAARTDDATFLRRVKLDLVGESPTPDEVMDFVLDTDPGKRKDAIQDLLSSAKFGQNWARYWRDVIMYRQSDPRGTVAAPSLLRYLEDKFNAGTSWKEIATEFITAEGDVRENGNTAIYMAHFGNGEEVAAEFSRLFLGIQIQCAQCHDHPTDRWKREQFHELAAFLPRVQVRAVQNDEGPRSFQVISRENNARRRRAQANRRRPTGREHYMSDLEDPSSRGTLTHPKFFVSNRSIPKGETDKRRRNSLAVMITAQSNPWFAKAFVNRIWAEMVGEGFYEPIDDLGPDRQCSAPETMDYLSEQFIAADYDVKWLYETIANTDAYQRASRERRRYTEAAFAANCAQRLRGDQLYDVLTDVLALNTSNRRAGNPRARRNARNAFTAVFGYDPSMPRDELTGSIPQALYMMNASTVTQNVRGNRADSALAKILQEFPENDDAVTELYLRCLARVPSKDEAQTCRDYLAGISNRREGMEDIFWVLVNTAEFLHRR